MVRSTFLILNSYFALSKVIIKHDRTNCKNVPTYKIHYPDHIKATVLDYQLITPFDKKFPGNGKLFWLHMKPNLDK